MLGSPAAGLGADQGQVAAVATNLAAFVALGNTATALVRDTGSKATLSLEAEELTLLTAQTDKIITIDATVGAAAANKHAISKIATHSFVVRHLGERLSYWSSTYCVFNQATTGLCCCVVSDDYYLFPDYDNFLSIFRAEHVFLFLVTSRYT